MGDVIDLRIDIGDGEELRGMLELPEEPLLPAVLLAPGAGAGQDHPWLRFMRGALAGEGFPTMTFDYRYAARGRKAPDRLPVLVDVHEAAAEALRLRFDRLVLAGKSMGGRVGSHLVADRGVEAEALVYYGYPLVPMGRGEPRDVSHLRRIDVPQLFFAGTRDRLSPPDAITRVAAELPSAGVEVISDADHSFRVPKRAGRTHEEVLAGLAASTGVFLRRLGQDGGGR